MPNEMTIEEWLEWMRKPVDYYYLTFQVLQPDRKNRCENGGPSDDNIPEDEGDLPDDDLIDNWLQEEENRLREAAKEFWKVSQYAGLAPKAMAFLRSQPPSGNIPVPLPEESEWMSPKERDLVEWFDRGEYGVFLRLSALFDLTEGWIVRYCVTACVRYKRGVESDVSIDLHTLFNDELVTKIRIAAAGGNARALNCLGLLSKTGYAGDKIQIDLDKMAARDFFRRSAEAGCTQAMVNYALSLADVMAPRVDFDEAERIFRELSARGLGRADLGLTGVIYNRSFYDGASLDGFTDAMLRAARRGNDVARQIVAAAGEDLSSERLVAEYLYYESWFAYEMRERLAKARRRSERWPPQFPTRKPTFESIAEDIAREHGRASDEPALSVSVTGIFFDEDDEQAAKDRKLVADGQPPGAVVPPAGGRETVRTPNLTSANPSFAARLVIYVRDRFGGDAPKVYTAAHVSRKTYSSIVSNELRPVSKTTAILLALGLRLKYWEAVKFIRSAGFAFSEFILEDVVVSACIKADIHDVNRINQILAAHRAKPFPAAEE